MIGRRAGLVAAALLATLTTQAVLTLAILVVPVVAPAAAADVGVHPRHVGLYASLTFIGAMVVSLVSGGLILRLGAIRVCQICLAIGAVGVAAAAGSTWWLLAASALTVGVALGPTTPASSHLLARLTPAQLRSLVFSIKQTSVPLGGAIAGVLVPFLVLEAGWRGAALAVAGICLAWLVVVAPARKLFDADLSPGEPVFRGGIVEPLRFVLAHPRLRELALVSLTYSGMQQCVSVFLVTYLVIDLAYPLVTAGLALSVAQLAGVAGRVAWGGLADYAGDARAVLGGTGLATAAGAMLLSGLTGDWPLAAVLVLCGVLGATAIGWNGVYLAEVARLVPFDQVGRATGGALSVTFFGVVALPPLFGAVAALAGSYGAGFAAMAVLTGAAALALLRPGRRFGGG